MPQYDIPEMRRVPFDPKMAREISRSPAMSREQGPDFLSGWGGTAGYQMFSELPMYERLTYAAILEGHTTQDAIEVVTGLTSGEVSIGLEGLEKRRLISTGEVTK